MDKKVFRITVPEYSVESKPDYIKIGKRVDDFIKNNFSDGKYVVRAIGSQDHPNYSLNELINAIVKVGTDKYDRDRVSVFDEEFSGYDYDFQAGSIEIKNGEVVDDLDDKYPGCFANVVYHFYEHTPIDRGYAIRVDLLLIYAFDRVERGCLIDDSKKLRERLSECLWKFKDSSAKQDALVGVIVIDK